MPSRHYETILRWVYPYPAPPVGFDATLASDRQLAEYGLPTRPSKESEGYGFWHELLARPAAFSRAEFPIKERLHAKALRTVSHRHLPGMGRGLAVRGGGGFGHLEKSGNWSGAYITPIPRPNRFVLVTGAWTVPEPMVPVVRPSGSQSEEYRSSTWIGLGGQRHYNSLPQIGTSQHATVINGALQVETAAWWQWWVDGRPEHHVPIPILNFEVKPGDEILAALAVEAPWPGEVRFNLKNQRTGQLVAFKVGAPSDIPRLGATAEWIHERPTRFGSEEQYPLPHCTELVFRHCLAWSSPDLGAPATVQRLADNVRLIRMMEMFDAPRRTATVSVPERRDPSTLSIVYREAGPSGSTGT